MKKYVLPFVFGLFVLISGCDKKEDDPVNPNVDNTPAWTGTYTGAIGGSNTVNQVVITKVDNTHLKMQLKVDVGGTFYTFATINNAEIKTATNATINEDGLIFGQSDTYHFSGSGLRNGNELTLSGNGKSTTNSSDIKYYYFNGTK